MSFAGHWAVYRHQHKACPRCRGLSIETTCVGYVHPPDLNRAFCHGCGWRGIVDELTHDPADTVAQP